MTDPTTFTLALPNETIVQLFSGTCAPPVVAILAIALGASSSRMPDVYVARVVPLHSRFRSGSAEAACA